MESNRVAGLARFTFTTDIESPAMARDMNLAGVQSRHLSHNHDTFLILEDVERRISAVAGKALGESGVVKEPFQLPLQGRDGKLRSESQQCHRNLLLIVSLSLRRQPSTRKLITSGSGSRYGVWPCC